MDDNTEYSNESVCLFSFICTFYAWFDRYFIKFMKYLVIFLKVVFLNSIYILNKFY
jgi:hypothetical protein